MDMGNGVFSHDSLGHSLYDYEYVSYTDEESSRLAFEEYAEEVEMGHVLGGGPLQVSVETISTWAAKTEKVIERSEEQRSMILSRLNKILMSKKRIHGSADSLFVKYARNSIVRLSTVKSCVKELGNSFGIALDESNKLYELLIDIHKVDQDPVYDVTITGYTKQKFRMLYRQVLIKVKEIYVAQFQTEDAFNRDVLWRGGWKVIKEGDRIENYLNVEFPKDGNEHLVRRLGEGNFGEVYECQEVLRANRTCAVKRVPRDKHHKMFKLHEAFLKREIQVLKSADHPHVVQIYDVYTDQNYHYLVMELMKGGSFGTIKPSKRKGIPPKSEQWLARVFKQLLQGIAYCHSNGIIHRDLKPDNIMFYGTPEPHKDPTVKIVDFGLADRCGPNHSVVDGACGTNVYWGPEIRMNRQHHKGSDIFAIGVLIYEMVTGFHPFHHPSFDVNAVCGSDPTFAAYKDHIAKNSHSKRYSIPKEGLTDVLYNLVYNMTLRDPRKRPSAQDCLRHDWFKSAMKVTLRPELEKKLYKRLEVFSRLNTLQIAVLNLVSHHLSYESSDVVTLFNIMDKNYDGVISLEEFTKNLKKFGLPIATIESWFRLIDASNNGSVTCSELMAACCTFNSANLTTRQIEAIQIAFLDLDHNKDGKLDLADFNSLFRHIEPTTLHKMAQFFDTENALYIDQTAFTEFITSRY